MRFVVDEMPITPQECPFYKDGECKCNPKEGEEFCDYFDENGEIYSYSRRCKYLIQE